MSTRYQRLDVITEGGRGARRWQIIAVEQDYYLVHSLFGAAEPAFNRWPHAEAEARTSLENRITAEQIGVVCACGCAYRLPGHCRWCPRPESAPVHPAPTET